MKVQRAVLEKRALIRAGNREWRAQKRCLNYFVSLRAEARRRTAFAKSTPTAQLAPFSKIGKRTGPVPAAGFPPVS